MLSRPDGRAPPLDPECYGYPGGFALADGSVQALFSGRAAPLSERVPPEMRVGSAT